MRHKESVCESKNKKIKKNKRDFFLAVRHT